jgi:hypothetical protein
LVPSVNFLDCEEWFYECKRHNTIGW